MSMNKKIKSTIMVSPDIYREIRILAIRKDMDISSLVEEALREKITREYQTNKEISLQLSIGEQNQPSPQQSPQQATSNQKQKHSHIFDNDVAHGFSIGEGEIRLYIPGLKFPTNKDKLVQIAKKYQATLEDHEIDMKSPLPFVEKLPNTNKTYHDVSQLEEDIVKICNSNEELISEAKEFEIYKIVGCVVNIEPEERKEEKQQSQQSQLQKPDIFRYDTLIEEDDYNVVFRLTVPKLEFPISKNDLKELSWNNKQEGDFGVLYSATQKLPKTNKKYKNVKELEEDVMMVYNEDMRNSGISKRITKCIILVDKNRKTTAQYLEDERLRRKTIPKTT